MIEIIHAVVFPIGRSIAGWAGNALKDNEITWPEWQQLVETVIRVGVIQTAIYLGVGIVGVDMPVLAAGGAAFLADKIFSALKKHKDVDI